MVDLTQQFFDTGANLFALRLEGLIVGCQTCGLGAGIRGFFYRGIPLLPEARYELYSALNSFFQTIQGIDVLFGRAHGLFLFEGGTSGFFDVEGGFRQFRQVLKGWGIVKGDIGQHLAIQV